MEGPPGALITPRISSIPISLLITRLIKRSYKSLTELLEQVPNSSPNDRKLAILNWLQNMRSQWIKLIVLLRWSREIPPELKNSHLFPPGNLSALQGSINYQETLITFASDMLHHNFQSTKLCRVPNYDIRTALDVFSTGNYIRLPSSIRSCVNEQSDPLKDVDLNEFYKQLQELLHYYIFSLEIPPYYTNIEIKNGRAFCEVKDEFSIEITLFTEEPLSWRLLSLDIFVKASKDSSGIVSEQLKGRLMNFLQYHISKSENPLQISYTILHQFCILSSFQILLKQAHHLVSGSKDFCIKEENEFIYIQYWIQKNNRTNTFLSAIPFINYISIKNISNNNIGNNNTTTNNNNNNNLNNNPYLEIIHHPVEIEYTHKPVIVTLSEISMEKVILQILSYHTSLLLDKLYKYLLKNINILPLSEKDIRILSTIHSDVSHTTLQIKIFSKELVSITIDTSSGFFTLQTSFIFDEIKNMEEKLNQSIDNIILIITYFKRLAIKNRIMEYMELLQLTTFKQLILEYPNNNSFRFTEETIFFRLKGWIKNNDDSQLNAFIAIELSEYFRLNIFFLLAKFESNLPYLQVEQINLLAFDLKIPDFNFPVKNILILKSNTYMKELLFIQILSHIQNLPLHDVLDTIVHRCYILHGNRSFIKANIKLLPQNNEEKISFIHENQKFTLVYSEERKDWEISVLIDEYPRIPLNISSRDKFKFDKDNSILKIYLDASNNYFTIPWIQLQVINGISKIADQWFEISQTNIGQNFYIEEYAVSYLSLAYNVPQIGKQNIIIGFKNMQYVLSIGFLLEPIKKSLEITLNSSKNLELILRYIILATYPLSTIYNYIRPSKYHYAQDFYLVPRGTTFFSVCLIYRDTYGIEISFLDKNELKIRDSKIQRYSVNDKHSFSQYGKPLPRLNSILRENEKHPKEDPSIVCNYCFHEYILNSVHKLMGCNYLLHKATKYLSINKELSDIRISENSVEFKVPALSHITCQIEITPTNYLEFNMSTNTSPSLDLAILKPFFRSICGEPYSVDNLIIFFEIIFLPIGTLDCFLFLLRARERGISLYLDFANGFTHLADKQLICFAVRCTEGNSVIDFPLQYYYKRNLIRYWFSRKYHPLPEGAQVTHSSIPVMKGIIQWMINSTHEELLEARQEVILKCSEI